MRLVPYTSLFDLFKVGLGPSSSHTVGPMRAANAFARELALQEPHVRVRRVVVDLYGSLALTGRGHATDRAVMLGLEGLQPDVVDPAYALERAGEIREGSPLRLARSHDIAFSAERDIVWRTAETLPRHSNAMRFSAYGEDGGLVLEQTYFSVGGGFIELEGAAPAAAASDAALPYPFDFAQTLLEMASRERLAIWEIVAANERALHGEEPLHAYVERIWAVMKACAQRGLSSEGVLPGGLNVRRRAARLFARYNAAKDVPMAPMDYVNAIAMAVNEENAAGGRVVTAPTNGAAGVIPAVLHYYRHLCDGATADGIARFLLTATAIGSLFKRNASISGAEVGCQGEVGVACSMAAGGLVAALGGTNDEVEYAAEIGMEHSLGMTCDPIGGLVQVPCIERNAVGAVRAIHAARMSMEEDGEHTVSLDRVVAVMYRTGLDMQSAYKETSLGGLAVSVVEC
ncbi:MAG: L-serine ammonia-lyase [Candidatus Eremiobacteraeota bacterium]|nr:L-serine ammonia-lyase [Candidatus Eremiobacteraeota bacterium]